MVGLCRRGMPPTEAELDKSNWLPLSLLKKARLGGAVKKVRPSLPPPPSPRPILCTLPPFLLSARNGP